MKNKISGLFQSSSEQKRNSTLSQLTGLAAIKSAAISGVRHLGESRKIIGLAGKILLPAKREPSDLSLVEDDQRRFELAALRHNATDETINSLRTRTFWTLWLYFGMCVLTLIWGVHLLKTSEDISGVDFH